jgi:hypothetical protein
VSGDGGGDWVERLMASFSNRLVGGLYEGIYALEEPHLSRVLDTQAEACVHAFVALADIPAELPFDEFLERLKTAGPGRVQVERLTADALLWTELHHGECVCPHVRREVIRLDPKLCLCGETWVRLLIERLARRRATV